MGNSDSKSVTKIKNNNEWKKRFYSDGFKRTFCTFVANKIK